MAVKQSGDRPTTISEYKEWLIREKKFDLSYSEKEYEYVQAAFEMAVVNSDIWKMLNRNLGDFGQVYYVKTSLELFHHPDQMQPQILRKPYGSFLDKTFRHSFVKPLAPGTGSLGSENIPHPSEYYGKMDDVLRTLVVVKFLDGVEFLIRKLDALCNACSVKRTVEYKNNDQGYFATHYYFEIPVVTNLPNGSSFNKAMQFEIQITTQLQEVLRRFLHFEYERNRSIKQESMAPWQWRYREHEFFSNYLGHMLRSIEGQIMDVRRRREIADACAE